MRTLIFITWAFSLPVLAQNLPVDAASGKIYFSEEVLIKDGPQTDLFNRAKIWFASSGKSVKTLVTEDVVNGLLIGNSQASILIKDGNKSQNFILSYKVKIEMEDDQFWYSLSDFYLQPHHHPKKSIVGQKPMPKLPLETILFLEQVNSKNYIAINKLLEREVYKSILDCIKSLKSSLL